jgi:hypothetical protein
MSETTENNMEDFEGEEDDYDENDYGFIIGPDGELKTLMLPEDLMDDPPPKVRKILKILGIKNIHQMEPRTLH